MITRFVPVVLLILCFFSKAHSQSCPPNLDFETGDFSHWDCFVGFTDTIDGKNRMTLNPSAPVSNRHEIISAATSPANDPYGGFPKLCPYGGKYSVKLGNTNTNAEAEAISYTFIVPTTIDTFTFTYFYAVVFEDPQHSPPEQPRFFVTAYDVGTGALINCASYDYVSTAALPGFQKSKSNPQVLYKNWTPTSLQFAGLGGHTVRLEFRTADCTLGGHFGYAYLDVASACSNILATAPYCIETNSLILDAPFGFQTYTWYNSDFSSVIGTGQSFTLSPPPVTSGLFYVDVVPYPGFGCRDTLQAFVKPLPVPPLPNADTVINYCQFASSVPLSAKALPGNQLLWYTSATGGIGTTDAIQPSTFSSGIFKYYVSQKALFGCEGFRKEITVHIIPTPVVSFNINNSRQCQNGNNFIFSSTSVNRDSTSYIWDFGDGKTFSSKDTFSIYSYTASGNFSVKLQASNRNTCSAEKSQYVTVIPKPVASFTFPSPLCENETPIILTDHSYVPSGIANISNWWWNADGKILQGQKPSSFVAAGGPLPVSLVVTTNEGCSSDTSTSILRIGHIPLLAFSVGDLLCNNETIRLSDQSLMPPGSVGEVIKNWTWIVDNSLSATTPNLSISFNAGIHQAKLTVGTNVGCSSQAVQKSFEIYPKPEIKLDITDSCVYVPITFTANDLDGDVVNWNWNFGSGFRTGPSSISTSYSSEGNRPFVLLTQTDKGCKDTIYRAFTVFTNKSFAGNDTVAAFNEPVQLNARGDAGMQYNWSPPVGLDHTDIEKPLAILDRDQQYQLYTVTDKGCKKQTQIFIKRYAGPEIYIPTAFTPNHDGLNDRFKIVPIGIKSFGYLAVYDRWGQQIFYTTNYQVSWDGTYKGAAVEPGTYVYYAQAIDYRGRPLFRKGTVTVIK
ncbi:MAG: PKD domain-containing protein [Flavisolibacter sp.]